MIVSPVKTEKILPGAKSIVRLIDDSVSGLSEGTVVAVASKAVSLCENRVVPTDSANKQDIMVSEADYYLESTHSRYNIPFTITNNTLIPMSGIDESNSNGCYVLWPKEPQKTANELREHLAERFGLKNIGVVITDSTCSPLRLGTTGIALAYSGFMGVNDYVGKPDLFGRPFKVSQSNVAGGLAASAVLAMGEGSEQTPVCIIEDVPFVEFVPRNPTKDELASMNMDTKDDIFAPFLSSVKWKRGGRRNY